MTKLIAAFPNFANSSKNNGNLVQYNNLLIDLLLRFIRALFYNIPEYFGL
jgi:hypothetical protein